VKSNPLQHRINILDLAILPNIHATPQPAGVDPIEIETHVHLMEAQQRF
jgi:hypothetical protein